LLKQITHRPLFHLFKTTGRRELERIEKDNKGQEKEKGRKETRYNKQERRRKVEK